MRVSPLDVIVRAQSMLHLAQSDRELIKELLWPSKESVQRYAAEEGKDWRVEYTRSRCSTLWPAVVLSTGLLMATCAGYEKVQGYQRRPAVEAMDTIGYRLDHNR